MEQESFDAIKRLHNELEEICETYYTKADLWDSHADLLLLMALKAYINHYSL